MVVALTPDIGVLQGEFGGIRFKEGLIETVLEDRANGRDRAGLDGDAARGAPRWQAASRRTDS